MKDTGTEKTVTFVTKRIFVMNQSQIILRPANRTDCAAIHALIIELATFEREPEEVRITVNDLERDGFEANPRFHVWVAESDGNVVGMALYYIKYSTWKGSCVFLEDIIVTESLRGRGIGRMLFDQVLTDARAMGARRMEWQVLDWNETALKFYEQYAPERLDDWLTLRIRLETA